MAWFEVVNAHLNVSLFSSLNVHQNIAHRALETHILKGDFFYLAWLLSNMMFSNYIVMSLIRKVTSVQRSFDVRASMLLRFAVCFASLVTVFDWFCRCASYFGLSEVSHRYLRMDDMLVSWTRRKSSPNQPMALSEIHQLPCDQAELKKRKNLVILSAYLGIFELLPSNWTPCCFWPSYSLQILRWIIGEVVL